MVSHRLQINTKRAACCMGINAANRPVMLVRGIMGL